MATDGVLVAGVEVEISTKGGVLVAGGVQLNKFLGLSPRKEHFRDREDEPKR